MDFFFSDTWFNYFVFGVIITFSNAVIYKVIKESNKIDLSLIGGAIIASLFFNGINYNLGETTKEALSISYAGISINIILIVIVGFSEPNH